MKKVLLIILSAFLLYGYLGQINLKSLLTILSGSLFTLFVSKLRLKYLYFAKYVVVALSLLMSLVLPFFPNLFEVPIVPHAVATISVCSILLFLGCCFMDERGILKSCLPLIVVYLSSAVNLFSVGKLPLIKPLCLAGIAYFYTLGSTKRLACLILFAVFLGIFLWMGDFNVFGERPSLSQSQKVFLFFASFCLFSLSFFLFVRTKDENPAILLFFFGMLSVVFDVILLTGLGFGCGLFKEKNILATILIISAGPIMKRETELI